MHPNTFLRSLWRGETRDEVFVAMSFDKRYQTRFDDVIKPAIQQTKFRKQLEPYRVDISKTGDSILTDIIEGIAHCQLVLADVSSVGRDAVNGQPYRNGNVMYEVGIALASRQPAEVLLIRDDDDRFLFDVSTVPHLRVNFSDVANAVALLTEALEGRLRERDFLQDARVQMAARQLAADEARVLTKLVKGKGPSFMLPNMADKLSIYPRLLNKGLVEAVGQVLNADSPAYYPTRLGRAVLERLKQLPVLGVYSPSSPNESTKPDADR
jgi:hypothetical protein